MTPQEKAYDAERFKTERGELARILEANIALEGDSPHTGMVNLLDMLSDLAKEHSSDRGDRWYGISRLIGDLSTKIEHQLAPLSEVTRLRNMLCHATGYKTVAEYEAMLAEVKS